MWLDSGPTTMTEFTDRLAKRLGAPVALASVSQWTAGTHVPRAEIQLAMSDETNGEVSPLAWAEWKAAQVAAARTAEAQRIRARAEKAARRRTRKSA